MTNPILRLRHGTIGRREAYGTALNLAVQEVGVGSEKNGGNSENPGKGDGGSAGSTGYTGKGITRAFQLGQVDIDEVTSRIVGVHDVHALLATSSTLVGLLAKLGRLLLVVPVSVLVVVVVLVVLLVLIFPGLVSIFTREALVGGDDARLVVRKFETSALLENAAVVAIGNDSAPVVVVHAELDRLAIRGTVRTHEVLVPVVGVVAVVVLVLAVIAIVVVVVVVVVPFNLCSTSKNIILPCECTMPVKSPRQDETL